MKTIYLLTMTLISIHLMGQKTIYYDSLYTYDSTHYQYHNKPLILDFNDSAAREYIYIDTTQQNNIWVFDSISKPGFLTSDSIFLTTGNSGTYDTSLYSSFIIKLKTSYDANHKWFSSFGLGFIHKYDTDSAFDGLIIEYSADGGSTWNYAIDQIQTNWAFLYVRFWDSTYNWNLYNYIPNTNIQINSGKSDSLIHSRIAWGFWGCKTQYDSILFKVSFRSDNINSQKPGWAIQKIIVEGGFFESGGFEETNLNKDYQIYSYDKSLIVKPLTNDLENAEIRIYSILGKSVYPAQKLKSGINKINLYGISQGIYFVEISSEKGRLVKKVFLH